MGFRGFLAAVLALNVGAAAPAVADRIDECHEALEVGDKNTAMIMAQSIRIFQAPSERALQLRALDCLHQSLDGTFLVVNNKFVSSEQVQFQMEELEKASAELEELHGALNGTKNELVAKIASRQIEILYCDLGTLTAVIPFILDGSGNRVSMLTESDENEVELFDGKRVTLVSKAAVTVIDGYQLFSLSGNEQFKAMCDDISRDVARALTRLSQFDWGAVQN
ncbi:hypothetical protein QO034_06330 [Sedimentitalea sp. JM2-8]|uniref:Uncharacterized protein n=1 Tax=Sedimentitalea xiamensis TaxID=3050037 RepID=A0ABT7FCD4_9RHOB|nr:hypothetical protein [Sedimentitalea xiamensis]MDK3072720.1 hypothetical protein [Sedimentitalea xiamensis]